jgi:D-mannonate dehydratase
MSHTSAMKRKNVKTPGYTVRGRIVGTHNVRGRIVPVPG